MLINEDTAVSTSGILLVPYRRHHVSTYHEWMKDEEIQWATASEPLTMEEELSMQQSWLESTDKLTFISCLPKCVETSTVLAEDDDAPCNMLGDVNLFLFRSEEDDHNIIIGELELMIAVKASQGQGFGRASLLAFVEYMNLHETAIIATYTNSASTEPPSISYLRVKIAQDNKRSISLFGSIGFVKISEATNYFGEYEMRTENDLKTYAKRLTKDQGLDQYREFRYVTSD